MVVFTCQNCGESLKKNAVEKHLNLRFKCGSSPVLTCIDCLKDFLGTEYVSHTKCVSESERYAKKGSQIKKEGTAQDKWMIAVNEAMANANINQRTYAILEYCCKFENVPRKKNKFLNFVKSSNVKFSQDDLDLCFEIIQFTFEKLQLNYAAEKEKCEKNVDHKKISVQNGVVNNDEENEVQGRINGGGDETKRKKNKDKKKEKAADRYQLDVENSAVDVIAPSETEQVVTQPKLSKKEKKEKAKREKYEAELKAIEHACPADAIDRSDNDNQNSKDAQNNSGKGSLKAVSGQIEMRLKKKKKKRCISEPGDQPSVKKIKGDSNTGAIVLNEPLEETNRPLKFDWSKVIVQLLHSSEGGELPLKRLCKKVVTEYQMNHASHKTYEDIMAIFHKKVQKTVGVRVLKDKAKLINVT